MGLFSDLFDQSVETESSSRAYPWRYAGPGLRTGADLIGGWMERPREFFPGQTYADYTPTQLRGIEELAAGAGGAGAMLPGMVGGWQTALGGPEAVLEQGLQDVASNPYLAGIADVMERRSEERMLEDVLPQMEASAVGAGGLGGSRLALQAGQAERDRQRALDDALAGLYGDAWARGLGAETSRYNQAQAGRASALGMTPAMMGAYAMPGAQLMTAGGYEQAMDQNAINEAMARHQYAQAEPFERATLGMGALMPSASDFAMREGKSTQTSQPSMFGRIGELVGLGAGLIGGGFGMLPGAGFGAASGFGMGPLGYGMGYGINPMGQQASMLSQQWGPYGTGMWG